MLDDEIMCTLSTMHECAVLMMLKHNVEGLRNGTEVYTIVYSHS